MHAFWCALLLVSLVFGEVFFAGTASLHDWFLHFLVSAFLYIVTPQLRYPMNVFPIMTVTTDSLVAFFIAIPPYEYKHPSDTKYNHPKTRNSELIS